MDDKFLTGIVLGIGFGALIVTNSVKARQIVKEGQQEVKAKMEQLSAKSKKQSE